MTTTRIPVTILTGFLGSGKTTFINYLLKENHGQKLAIIENEFGEVGIDDGLVIETQEEIIEMMNGCICCTVRDDLRVALKKLATEQRDKFTAIIIETTGLADPAPVAQTFFIDDDISELFVLDSIITFVDAVHVSMHLAEVKPEGVENEAVEQVAFADVLVINKTDLVGEKDVEKVVSELRSINATAKIMKTSHSRLPLEDVLNIRAFDLDKTLAMDDAFLNVDEEHIHDSSVSSVGVVIEGEFIPQKFQEWLSDLLQTKGQDIFRSKGIVSIAGSDERFVFQGVHMLLNFGPDGQVWPPGPRKNKLCFIGRNLERKKLVEELQECIFNGKFPEPGEPPKDKLRFPIGARVLVNVGGWVPGIVVKHWYREPFWETDRYVPYQVRVEGSEGMLVWAPKDHDKLIRACRT